MNLFALSGTIDKREFREILFAVITLAIVLATADLFGWLSFPLDGLPAPTLEELPRLMGLGVPLLVAGWIMFAAMLKRCRDADFPVPLFLGLSMLCIVATFALGFMPGHSGLLRQCLKTFVAFTEILLLMLSGALALFDDLTLHDRSSARVMERPYRGPATSVDRKLRFSQKN